MGRSRRQGEQTGETGAQRPGRYLQLETTARDGSQDRNDALLGVCPVDAGCWQGGDDGLGGAVRCLGGRTKQSGISGWSREGCCERTVEEVSHHRRPGQRELSQLALDAGAEPGWAACLRCLPVYGLLLGVYGLSIISPFSFYYGVLCMRYAMRIRCPKQKTEKTRSGSLCAAKARGPMMPHDAPAANAL
ncbi:hypothetical protein TESG_04316 [Trichophyton tonsurans CBS 112818]|uniref:Uncharacterized protein n=1 Tax=Trichophyton tonsurans (strain CBS 112818) TaxID=647933 RepID=F2RZU0_TRIT1|nr:hypothetical protein TESG_04316 [Trichophyton tonsurans CBS 112818]